MDDRITWPFELTARMWDDAVSKHGVVDYLFSKYYDVKGQFEKENECQIEWTEIRVKRDATSIHGLVEFKKVEEKASAASIESAS